MGIFDFWARGSRASRARANAALGRLDDAGLGGSLEVTLQQLRGEVERMGVTAAEAAAQATRLQREQERLEAQAEDWRGKARQALQGGREDLAKTALGRAQEALDQARALGPQRAQADERAQDLRAQVERGRTRIAEAERTASALAARRSAAAAQKKVARALEDLDEGDSAFATLSRLERKIEEEEAVAAAYEEIVRGDREAGGGPAAPPSAGGGADLDAQLRALEDELRRGS